MFPYIRRQRPTIGQRRLATLELRMQLVHSSWWANVSLELEDGAGSHIKSQHVVAGLVTAVTHSCQARVVLQSR